MRIGVVAPSSRFSSLTADAALAFVREAYAGRVELVFHPQCFEKSGHFAGDDGARAAAFIEVANDPRFDALWFARGGYGSCRMAEAVLDGLAPAAAEKAYIGYSDAGSLLAGLYRRGFARVAHGPMPQDLMRDGGAAAVKRSLDWLLDGDKRALEPHAADHWAAGRPTCAFNLTILSQLLGTPLEPDLTGHVLMIEEVSEQLYRIDRTMFHVTSQPAIRRVAGLRLGRCSDIPDNDPPFGQTPEEIARFWCRRSGIPFLGMADIGHDTENRVVPFGLPQN